MADWNDSQTSIPRWYSLAPVSRLFKRLKTSTIKAITSNAIAVRSTSDATIFDCRVYPTLNYGSISQTAEALPVNRNLTEH
jgi:hypothetical protein